MHLDLGQLIVIVLAGFAFYEALHFLGRKIKFPSRKRNKA